MARPDGAGCYRGSEANQPYASTAETESVFKAADANDAQYRWLQRMLYAIDPHQHE